MPEKVYEVLGLEFVHPLEPRPVGSQIVKIETVGYFPTEDTARAKALEQGFVNQVTPNPSDIVDRNLLAGWFIDQYYNRDERVWLMREVEKALPEMVMKVLVIDTFPLPHPKFPSMTRRSIYMGGLGI